MTSSLDASIIPITLTINGKTGLTLWAPPWEDDDGEEWQGFLGDGAKILLYPSARDLADFIATGAENDLSDHPAWGRVIKLKPDDLKPSGEDDYDLDQVYEWAAGESDPVHVSALANVVDMVANIADCCDDGKLKGLVVNSEEFSELVSDDVSYQGKDGAKRWSELGDKIAASWERILVRVESWCSWQGDFTDATDAELEAETVWDHVGAEPIALIFDDGRLLTVRGYVDSDEASFLGSEGEIVAFTEVADLAHFCRTAKSHDLVKLEWWSELAEEDDDEIFEPAEDAVFDLSTASEASAEVVQQLVAFCDLEADGAALGDPDAEYSWESIVAEIRSCLQLED
jgi:hypothetical protein